MSLDGLSLNNSHDGDPIFRAYLNPPNPKAININVHKLTDDNRSFWQAQSPLAGQEGREEHNSATGLHHLGAKVLGHPAQRTYFPTTRKSEVQFFVEDRVHVTLSVQPTNNQDEALRVAALLDLDCLGRSEASGQKAPSKVASFLLTRGLKVAAKIDTSWQTCSDDGDCTLVVSPCGSQDAAVNRRFEDQAKKAFSDSCANAPPVGFGLLRALGTPHCVEGRCQQARGDDAFGKVIGDGLWEGLGSGLLGSDHPTGADRSSP